MPKKAKTRAGKPTNAKPARTERRTLPRARTKEVLGPPRIRERIPAKWQSHYQHLLQLHNTLLRSKDDLTQQAREEKPVFSEHMADAGTDNYDQDFALSMASSEQNALYEIEEAMKRIKDATYGVCEMTGKPIERERLNAIPWTRFSADAERELEQRGEVQKARLADRMGVIRSEAVDEEPEEEATE
jgi:DnaK suppressor protein